MILLQMNILRGALQRELNNFFKIFNGSLIAENVVTKGAFTKARKKFSYTAFIELNNFIVEKVKTAFPLKTWRGFRLVGIDGSTLKLLQNIDEILKHFGVQKNGNEKGCSMARISQSFDVLNGISIDTVIAPIEETDELSLAAQHILKAEQNDLFLFDRNYPAFWLFWLMRSKKTDFCARAKTSWSNQVKAFLKSGKCEKVVKLCPNSKATRPLREMGYTNIKAIKVRFIRVELETGETEVLITSLLNKAEFPVDIFKELYFHRWPIEEDYKVMKHRVEIGNFSGKTVESVYQDFHAKVLTKNLTVMLALSTRKTVEKNTETRRYSYKINLTEALSYMKNSIIVFFKTENLYPLIEEFLLLISKIVEPFRKGRSYKRKKKRDRRVMHPSYKPI